MAKVSKGAIAAGGDYVEHEFVNHGDLFCGDNDLKQDVLPSRTQQHFAEEVDINTIVKRFGLTGELPENVPHILQGDFTNVLDFQSAMDMVVAAREAFMEQPAEVRARFDNDPQKFLQFTSNKDNLDEAIKLGLVRQESVSARAEALAAARKAEIAAAVEVEVAARRKAAEAAGGPSST